MRLLIFLLLLVQPAYAGLDSEWEKQDAIRQQRKEDCKRKWYGATHYGLNEKKHIRYMVQAGSVSRIENRAGDCNILWTHPLDQDFYASCTLYTTSEFLLRDTFPVRQCAIRLKIDSRRGGIDFYTKPDGQGPDTIKKYTIGLPMS